MKSKKALSAASYPSRIFKNDVTIKCPGCMVLCSGGCLTVAANSKNKETTTSLFFSRRQRSKVIARVTRNSPDDSFSFLLCIPCPAGQWPYLMRPMVATSKVTSQPTDPLPMVTPAVCCVNAFAQSPDGRFRFGLNEYFQSKYYRKQGRK